MGFFSVFRSPSKAAAATICLILLVSEIGSLNGWPSILSAFGCSHLSGAFVFLSSVIVTASVRTKNTSVIFGFCWSLLVSSGSRTLAFALFADSSYREMIFSFRFLLLIVCYICLNFLIYTLAFTGLSGFPPFLKRIEASNTISNEENQHYKCELEIQRLKNLNANLFQQQSVSLSIETPSSEGSMADAPIVSNVLVSINCMLRIIIFYQYHVYIKLLQFYLVADQPQKSIEVSDELSDRYNALLSNYQELQVSYFIINLPLHLSYFLWLFVYYLFLRFLFFIHFFLFYLRIYIFFCFCSCKVGCGSKLPNLLSSFKFWVSLHVCNSRRQKQEAIESSDRQLSACQQVAFLIFLYIRMIHDLHVPHLLPRNWPKLSEKWSIWPRWNMSARSLVLRQNQRQSNYHLLQYALAAVLFKKSLIMPTRFICHHF